MSKSTTRLIKSVPLLAALLLVSLSEITSAAPAKERIPLWPSNDSNGINPPDSTASNLTIYRPDQPNGTIVVICPGGGYGGLVTGPEGTAIAAWLNRHDIIGAVLEYRLPQGTPTLPLLDVQRAIRLVRSKAAGGQGDTNRIGIIGFSAGGHLASTAGTHFEEGNPNAADPVERFGSRPDFMVLVYPVITMGPLAHAGSKRNLLGPSPADADIERFSNEKHVTARTPPCFLTHAKDDTVVPSEHSRLFAEALKAHRIPVQYLELPSGGHGLNGSKGPSWDAWQTRSLQWLAAQGLLTQKNIP